MHLIIKKPARVVFGYMEVRKGIYQYISGNTLFSLKKNDSRLFPSL